MYPDLMKEWDYIKNKVNPRDILPNSTQEAFWICSKCGHHWNTKVVNRTNKKHGCRLCSNQEIVIGINDLTTTRPDLLIEWNYEKNEKGPECYSEHSNIKVWWKCSVCEHEWFSEINMKSRGHRCPCCSGRVPKIGVNDLATLMPDVAKEWDYERNELGPENYKINSHAYIAWNCLTCGHKWENSIRNRTRNPGCPMCKKEGRYLK